MRLFRLSLSTVLVAGLVLPVFASCASLAKSKWPRFQEPNGHFSVEFPPGPVQKVADDQDTLYRLSRGRTMFAASTFPAETKRPNLDEAFTKLPVGFARSVRGRVVSAKRVDRPGLSGVATRVKTGEGACETRFYNRAARFFFLVVCFPGAEEDSLVNQRFFDSLRVP